MIVSFRFKNYTCFKDEAELSLVTSGRGKEMKDGRVIDNRDGSFKLLTSAVLYGANASGKSQFIEAYNFFRSFVLASAHERQHGDPTLVEPFALSDATQNAPSEFEIQFIAQNDHLYRYGFILDNECVHQEWLFEKDKRETEVFFRDGKEIECKGASGKPLKKLAALGVHRDNALFLSTAAQLNNDLAKAVLDWFRQTQVISELHEDGYKSYPIGTTKEAAKKKRLLRFLQAADLGIEDLSPIKLDVNDLPSFLPDEVRAELTKRSATGDIYTDVHSARNVYDDAGNVIQQTHFSMNNQESMGTQKLFALAGPILDVLENGSTLFVDELDAKLHSDLVTKVVELFHSPITNPKNAQLIFNTHNTNLLNAKLFRRDQIWFLQKNRYGAAELFSLADFKTDKVRKGEAYEDNYLKGKYGAVPILGDFSFVSEPLSSHGDEE